MAEGQWPALMGPGRVIALVGAECTGKSSLARQLADSLADATGLRCVTVAEVLREWCDHAGRTPRLQEQSSIAAEQARRIMWCWPIRRR
jgi:nicotinamide riboside kinase